MNRRVDDYIAAARQFERLARLEMRPDARVLLLEQAQTCDRLARKQAREISPTQPGGSLPLQ